MKKNHKSRFGEIPEHDSHAVANVEAHQATIYPFRPSAEISVGLIVVTGRAA